jgi:hypothetical protein
VPDAQLARADIITMSNAARIVHANSSICWLYIELVEESTAPPPVTNKRESLRSRRVLNTHITDHVKLNSHS